MANTNRDKDKATPAPASNGDNSPEAEKVVAVPVPNPDPAPAGGNALEPARGESNGVQIPGNAEYGPNATELTEAPAEDGPPVYIVGGKRVGPNGYRVDADGNEIFPPMKQRQRRPR